MSGQANTGTAPEGTTPEAGSTETATSTETSRTFTQAELDRIVADRLARERSKFADYDDLKAAAQRLAEIEAAQKSDLEKAQEAAQQAAERAAQLEAALRAERIRVAVTTEATKSGAVDPEAVLALLPKDAVTIGDDGQVTGAADAVKQLLEQRPYLVGSNTTPPARGSQDGGGKTPPRAGDLATQIREAEAKGDWATARALKAKQLFEIAKTQK